MPVFDHNKLECGPDFTPLVKSLPGNVRIINQLLQHTVYGVIYSENVYIYFIAIILLLYIYCLKITFDYQ